MMQKKSQPTETRAVRKGHDQKTLIKLHKKVKQIHYFLRAFFRY